MLPGTTRGVILVFRSPADGDKVDYLVATSDPEIKNGSKEATGIQATIIMRGYNLWATCQEAKVVRWRDGDSVLPPEQPLPRGSAL